MHELPLVIFTIVSQLSVGSFIVLGLIHLFGARAGRETVDRVSDPALYAIGPILALGLLVSMFHLGSPLRALNSLKHLDSSWLSREILVGLLFAVCGAAFACAQWRKWLTPVLRQVLAGITAVIGLALIWVTANVYLVPTVPAWNSWATPLRFLITAVFLGALAVGVALTVVHELRLRRGSAPAAHEALIQQVLRWLGVLAMTMFGLESIVQPLYFIDLGSQDTVAAQTSMDIAKGPAQIIALILVFAGIALVGALIARIARGRAGHQFLTLIALGSFVLVFVGEFLGRIVFFDMFSRIGM